MPIERARPGAERRAAAGARVLFLVDTDPADDPRARLHLEALEAAGASISVLPLHRQPRPRWLGLFDPLAAALVAEVLWRHGARAFGLTRRLLRGMAARYRLPGRPLAYTPLALRHILAFTAARRTLGGARFDVVVANDLYCGVAGLLIARRLKAELIYDTHELQLFRNVRNSAARVFWTFCFEQAVVAASREVIVVCDPIARLYRALYRPAACRVIENRGDLAGVAASAQAAPPPGPAQLVHFGSTTRGRGVRFFPDLLASPGAGLVFFTDLSDETGRAERDDALAGPVGNRARVHGLLKDVTTAMEVVGRAAPVFSLCLIEDVCLSYRLALPNKLIESLANRMPLICLEGTHVARLVRARGLGLVLSEADIRAGALPTRMAAFLAEWPRFEAAAAAFFARRRERETFARFWTPPPAIATDR